MCEYFLPLCSLSYLHRDFTYIFFLIEGYLLHSSVLISAIHQHELSVGIHISPPSWSSLPPPAPSHPSRLSQSPGLSSLSHTANSHWLSILHVLVYMFPCCSLHSAYPLLSATIHPHSPTVSISLFPVCERQMFLKAPPVFIAHYSGWKRFARCKARHTRRVEERWTIYGLWVEQL